MCARAPAARDRALTAPAFVCRWSHRIQECSVDGSANPRDCLHDLHRLADVWLLARLRGGLRWRKQQVYRWRQQVLVPRRRQRCWHPVLARGASLFSACPPGPLPAFPHSSQRACPPASSCRRFQPACCALAFRKADKWVHTLQTDTTRLLMDSQIGTIPESVFIM